MYGDVAARIKCPKEAFSLLVVLSQTFASHSHNCGAYWFSDLEGSHALGRNASELEFNTTTSSLQMFLCPWEYRPKEGAVTKLARLFDPDCQGKIRLPVTRTKEG